MATETVGILRALLTLDSAAFQSGLSSAERSLKGFERTSGRLGRQLSAFGSAATRGITLPLVAMGTATSKFAIDFESSFAGVRKTVDATEQQFTELASGFRQMSREIPINVNEINRIGEAAGQLGIKTENIQDFVEVMAKLGVTTNLSAEEAATSLARLANITQMPQDQFDRLGATIVDLGNNFATTEAEIVEFGLRIAGAGNQIGLTEAQILGIGAALSSVGINAEAGGTAISRVMVDISKAVSSGGEELEQFAEVAGMTSEQFAAAFREDAAGAIVSFVEGLGRIQSEGGDTFAILDEMGLGTIRVRDALLRAAGAGDIMRRSLENSSTAWQENTALTEEAQKRFETTASELTKLWNRLKDVGITIGNALLPTIRSLSGLISDSIPVIERFAEAFANMPGWMQGAAVGAAGLLAAIGPLALAFGGLLSAASSAAGALGAGGLLAVIGTALTGPIGLAVLAIAGAGGLVAALMSIETGVNDVEGPLSRLQDLVRGLTGVIKDLGSAMMENGVEAIKFWRDVIGTAAKVIEEAVFALQVLGEMLFGTFSKAETAAAQLEQGLSRLDPKLGSIGVAFTVLTDSTRDAEEVTERYKRKVDALVPAVDGLSSATEEAAGSIDKVSEEAEEAVTALSGLASSFDHLAASQARTREALQNIIDQQTLSKFELLSSSVQELSISLEDVGAAAEAAGHGMDELEEEGESAASSILEAFKKLGAEINNVFRAAFEGGGGVIGALKSLATSALEVFGSMIPGIGPIISQFSGAIVAGFQKLFGALSGGPSEAELAARKMVGDFTDTFVAGLNDGQILEAQQALADGWEDVNDAALLIGVRDMFVEAGKSAEEGEAAVKQLWDAIKNGGPEAVEAAIAHINEVGEEAARVAGKAGEDGKSAMDKIAQAQEQQKKQFGEMESAAQKYGVNLHALGPAFKKAKIAEEAHRIVGAFDTMNVEGANTKGILRGMADEANGVVHQAMKFGTSVPESMRPMLEKMLAAGLLTNEAGEELKSLKDIKFEGPPKKQFENITESIADAIEKVDGEGGLSDVINNIPDSKTVKIRFDVGPLNLPSTPESIGVPTHRMQHGGMGTVTGPAFFAVEPGVREQFAFSGAGQTFSSRGLATNVTIDARGALLGDYNSQRQLARLVNEAVVGDAELGRRF